MLINKSRELGVPGAQCVVVIVLDHKHRTQFLRTVSIRQMYSYMASHHYLYQIVFTHLALNSRTCFRTFQFIPDESDLTQL